VRLRDGTLVLFRPEVEEDLEMLWEMYSTLGEESKRFLPPIRREIVEGWIGNLDYDRVLPILATVGEPGGGERVVAAATLMFFPNELERHKAEFGITVHDEYQGRGLGTELTRHMVEIARGRGLKKVFLKVFTNNYRAVHVYERCGFRVECRMEREHIKEGEYGDDYRMAVLL